jgi:hypothetical protein
VVLRNVAEDTWHAILALRASWCTPSPDSASCIRRATVAARTQAMCMSTSSSSFLAAPWPCVTNH